MDCCAVVQLLCSCAVVQLLCSCADEARYRTIVTIIVNGGFLVRAARTKKVRHELVSHDLPNPTTRTALFLQRVAETVYCTIRTSESEYCTVRVQYFCIVPGHQVADTSTVQYIQFTHAS
jgi:hypothetical protein